MLLNGFIGKKILFSAFGVLILFYWIRPLHLLNSIKKETRTSSVKSDLMKSWMKIGRNVGLLNGEKTQADNPQLIDAIRSNMLVPPSIKPYAWSNEMLNAPLGRNPSTGQTQHLLPILKTFTSDPFYVECGANDGEFTSNSIFLEMNLNWAGLLVEPDPRTYPKLASKNRKAWIGHFCLSSTIYPSITVFWQDNRTEPGWKSKGLGSSLLKDKNRGALNPVNVQCLPLYSVLLALNRTTVDFFSLDVEGSELDVLQTIPFDKVTFKVITVENVWLRQGRSALVKFMESKDYVHYEDVGQDSLFLHPTVAAKWEIQRLNLSYEYRKKRKRRSINK